MTCPDLHIVELYLSDRLGESERARFEAHLKVCSSCRDRLDEAQKNETILAEIKALRERPSTDADQSPSRDIESVEQAQTLLGDRYRVAAKVGQGAAGTVFQVFDTILNRSVAVKFLRRRHVGQDMSDRWNEGRAMGQISHPHVAQIYEIGEHDNQRFIVTEWVNGLPLTEAWTDRPRQQRLRIYLDLVAAVAEAHRRGIVHRDLKPSNVLVTPDGRVKVLDFGIALESRSLDSVERRLYRGTPAYSAPEQIAAPETVGEATDVFSLGVLLYQLLTDSLPFSHTDLGELFKAIRFEYPELPKAVEETVPIPLQNICLKALEKAPTQRYPDAGALFEDIHRYLRGEVVWSRPSFLTDKIQQEIFYHRQKLKTWYDNELITQREFDQLESIYERTVLPPDPSIIEVRKLSLSQVCLYLGGWIAVLGGFVLFYQAWDHIPSYWRPAPALTAAVLMVVSGLIFWYRRESRLAVGFLAMANLLVPMAILLALGHWHVLSPKTHPWGQEAIADLLSGPGSPLVLGNRQLYLSACCWLICSLVFLRTTRSSAFSLYAVIAFLAVLTCVYVISGMIGPRLPWTSETIAGRYLYPGVAMFALGAVLDRRGHAHYAWPLSLIGLMTMIVALTAIAVSQPTFFGWLGLKLTSVGRDKQMYLSFIANAVIYLLLATLCRLVGTRFQRRLAVVLNWLGPIHVLAPLRMLDTLQGGDLNVYRVLLPAASLFFVLGSVVRQMKSFFFSGLAGIAVSVHTFSTQCMYLDDRFVWPVVLIFVGMIWMFFSYLVPRWRARRALKGG